MMLIYLMACSYKYPEMVKTELLQEFNYIKYRCPELTL